MREFDVKKTTLKTRELLSNFSLFAIISMGKFVNEKEKFLMDKSPEKILEHYKSVIVFGGENKTEESKKNTSKLYFNFDKFLKPIEAVNYLDRQGYRSIIIYDYKIDISQVYVKEELHRRLYNEKLKLDNKYESRPLFHAIVTEAPLSQSILPK